MNTTHQRTLTITCTEGNEVTKKQHSCFIHNLIADASKAKPLIHWRRSNSKDGILYCSNGLAEGTLMTLRMLTEKTGVEFTYNRHGKLIYTAVEENGDINCDMHLQHLLHKVTCAVTFAEAAQRRNPLAEAMSAIKAKYPQPAEDLSVTVRDIMCSVDVDELIAEILDKPSMLSFSIAKNSVERLRLEALIRATASYIVNTKPKKVDLLLRGIGLQSLPDKKICASLKSASLAQIANSYVKFPDYNYGGLHPNQRNLKFAKDFIVNLLEVV